MVSAGVPSRPALAPRATGGKPAACCARHGMDAIRGYGDDEDDDEDDEESSLFVHIGDRELTIPAWVDLREDQSVDWLPDLDAESWSALIKDDDAVAFYDRPSFDASWRRVVIVRAQDTIHLFNALGDPAGRQG